MESLTTYVRGRTVPQYSEGLNGLLQSNARGDIPVAAGLPPLTELVRQGNSWMMSIPTGSAFTHVAGWPTTRAELLMHNGEPSNGKSLVIDKAWAAAITSIAAASAYTLLGQVVDSGVAPTDNTAVLIQSMSGRGTYGGRVKRAIANTAYGIASKWQVLETQPAGPAASIGLAVIADVQGGIVIPPGGLLLLNVIAGTAVGTGIIGVQWHEAQLDLG